MALPLRGCVVALAGSFGDARSPSNLKTWIESNGGIYVTKLSKNVTHLVCAKMCWKTPSPKVKQALALQTVHIVCYDWLEDSILERCWIKDDAYSMAKVFAKRQAQRDDMKRIKRELYKKISERSEEDANVTLPASETHAKASKAETQADEQWYQTVRSFEEGCALAEKDYHTENHHVYRDSTSFSYDITLTRPDIARNRNERYHIRLYESNHGPPFYYAIAATYILPGLPTVVIHLTPLGSTFSDAFTAWLLIFKLLTGVDWDLRLWGKQETAWGKERLDLEELAAMMQERGAADAGARNRFFVYTLPDSEEGKPLGEMGMKGFGRAKWGKPPVLGYVGGGLVDGTVEELRVEAERSEKLAREEARKKSHKKKKKAVVGDGRKG